MSAVAAAPRARRWPRVRPGVVPAVLPTVFVLVAFLLPLAGLLVLSLRPTDAFNFALPGFSLRQYREVLTTPYLYRSLLESLSLAVRVSVTCLVLAYPVAWYLARAAHGWRKTLVFTVTLSPLLASEVVRSFGWRIVMAGEGPVNRTLQALGLTDASLPLLRSPWTVFLAVVHVLLPFAVIALTASLGAIDDAVLRASADLGASAAQTFRRVVLPLSAPGLVAGAVIVFSLTMGIYVTPLLVGGANQPLAGLRVQSEAMVTFNQPRAAALSFVLLLVTLVVCAVVTAVGRLAERGTRG
ncbi:MAG: ABC transporter permease [Cellulomonas iranensis]|uniref:Spermidine/putrescine transport system permease protein n=1 Tax=Cellulomonas iranensis TaxID=76862 RepID=A0ABU0GJ97_9CELL|nr:ABC transporter permease [Cellulomonas iranensis]MBO9569350.1 ABC transporter permease [Cellulomonas iranensis]MDQ0425444.1 putative spermidine/putrescine transport system permease protein [Cellulomonas iranensis]